MRVVVDTSVWSLAFRRKEKNEITKKLTDLIIDGLVVMIGPIRQELLSGISDSTIFEKLKTTLSSYEDLEISKEDFELAAEYFNLTRKHGIQGSHTDFLICAVAIKNDLAIYTTDKDFLCYAKYLPIQLI